MTIKNLTVKAPKHL